MRCSTVVMNSIIDNQREILLSIQGTNIWSGQQPQQYNSQAIAWGGLRCVFDQFSFEFVDDHPHSHELFAVGKRYQFVAWAYLIGLIVPVPFWIMYKLWPKLRTDYLYTPMLWCVDDLSWLITMLIHQHQQFLHWLAWRWYRLISLIFVHCRLCISMVAENALSLLVC
jgi:OPT oligopeptide transporter protein